MFLTVPLIRHPARISVTWGILGIRFHIKTLGAFCDGSVAAKSPRRQRRRTNNTGRERATAFAVLNYGPCHNAKRVLNGVPLHSSSKSWGGGSSPPARFGMPRGHVPTFLGPPKLKLVSRCHQHGLSAATAVSCAASDASRSSAASHPPSGDTTQAGTLPHLRSIVSSSRGCGPPHPLDAASARRAGHRGDRLWVERQACTWSYQSSRTTGH